MKQTMLLRMVFASACLLGLGGTVGCNKPSPGKCREAILNIQTLLGTDKSLGNFDLEGEVRRCRGGSKRESVECASKATTIEELRKCDGWQNAKFVGTTTEPTGAAAGSATGSGSAAGSGSGAGSATGANAGSGAH